MSAIPRRIIKKQPNMPVALNYLREIRHYDTWGQWIMYNPGIVAQSQTPKGSSNKKGYLIGYVPLQEFQTFSQGSSWNITKLEPRKLSLKWFSCCYSWRVSKIPSSQWPMYVLLYLGGHWNNLWRALSGGNNHDFLKKENFVVPSRDSAIAHFIWW